MLADLDRFKAINDRFGHDAGDGVIRAFASLARNSSLPNGVDAPTASFGVVDSRDRNTGLQRLLREADRALYDAKAAGRNRAVIGYTGAGTRQETG